MKRLLFTLSVLVILSFSVLSVSAAESSGNITHEPETVAASGEMETDYVQGVLDKESASEVEYLRAILICLKDIDLYVQFFVTVLFAVGLTYYVILKPIRYFLY